MESALEVLSRAATMVNTNTDNRITINKELPTTKWRRDRRIRLSSEYHHSNHEPVGTVKPLGESNQSNSLGDNSMEIPLDMSVGASKPPPPPYRDPLPGSTFCTMSRPSVITQAPKREVISNQENKQSPKKPIVMCDDAPVTESISMVDHELDEHFRRSLGADYMNLFGKRLEQMKSTSSSAAAAATARKSPQTSPVVNDTSARVKETPTPERSSSNRDNSVGKDVVENIEMSVDDHFAKALGDTWKQLQQSNKSSTSSNHDDSEVNSDPENDSNAKDDDDDDDDDRASPKSDPIRKVTDKKSTEKE
ncbi:uncharacterized protein DDB_G0290587 [Sitodiplosis mosellana]|uniref:uncharacterized protein DDB_G0290587 n=1 Tax=Sitodiplosis mosellana TaxID=263140 RepID=UPI00244409BE|nr:uncharacterized protein DDB_G0290587 [Sitodiplosis mosellana]XP_055317041.1 uncharacterized protein DDB_G0290587 [Sitodiplosis mosellana]XP_055317042.1 uncharacterized protein DDB_G0290587 [Sitodiplosis mosellana]XP_055317043.1 uncharacterized protein DDB_G0290587 [Sitodiplosis mosellana]